MAQFYMNKQGTLAQSSPLVEVGNTIKSVKAMVSGVNNGLSGIGIADVGPALTAIESYLTIHAGKVENLSSTLSRIVLKYIEAESNIMGIPLFANPDFYQYLSVDAQNNIQSLVGTIANYEIELIPGMPFTVGEAIEFGMEVYNNAYRTSEQGIGIMPESITLAGETDWKELFSMDNPYFDQAETLHMVEYGVSEGISLYHLDGSLEGPYGSLNGEVNFLNAEASATAYAGLFTADGKFAPGVGVEAGASVSLFTAEGEARLGNQYLGAYVNGNVEVCSASLEGSISAGLYNSEGKFDPSLGAGVSAEAILAQAEGSVGGTVLGTDIGVTGSVGVGAGAHANIGLQDGVLSFEVGAYLGVGATVGFDIDFNDTYDTIVNAWDDASDWVCDRADDFCDWASDTWDDVTDAGAEFVDWITFWD